MRVIKISQVPAPVVSVDATVSDAVRVMQQARGGACAVTDKDCLVGIFSERDVMHRIVAAQLDPQTIKIQEGMTTSLETVSTETEALQALELMVSKHIRHLPVLDADKHLAGLLSIRNLLQYLVEDLLNQLNSMEAYFTADGPGG